jgi:hypothetical protein
MVLAISHDWSVQRHLTTLSGRGLCINGDGRSEAYPIARKRLKRLPAAEAATVMNH